jgi:hypothetical protein
MHVTAHAAMKIAPAAWLTACPATTQARPPTARPIMTATIGAEFHRRTWSSQARQRGNAKLRVCVNHALAGHASRLGVDRPLGVRAANAHCGGTVNRFAETSTLVATRSPSHALVDFRARVCPDNPVVTFRCRG